MSQVIRNSSPKPPQTVVDFHGPEWPVVAGQRQDTGPTAGTPADGDGPPRTGRGCLRSRRPMGAMSGGASRRTPSRHRLPDTTPYRQLSPTIFTRRAVQPVTAAWR